MLDTPEGGLEDELKTRLSLALIRFLPRCSVDASDSDSLARFAVRTVRRASIRSAGVASRIRLLLRVLWRKRESPVRERRWG